MSGRYIDQRGYVRLYRPDHPLAYGDGCLLEHRFVLFEAGVALPPRYHVHHKNGDRQDNRIENLEIMSCSEHTRLHKPAPTPEEARERLRQKNLRSREYQNEWRRRKVARLRAAKQASA